MIDRSMAEPVCRRMLSITFSLALVVASLAMGLVVLAGAALLETASSGYEVPPDRCVGLQVGSQHAGTTHLHVENAGPERVGVHLVFTDLNGPSARLIDDVPVLDPGASADLAFRTPAFGTVVQLLSSVRNLQASAGIFHDDGTASESRNAFLCLES